MRNLHFKGKFGGLKSQGFRFQKLYADDQIYYIKDIPEGTIDSSLFIRKSGGVVRSFIDLDFGALRMGKHFGEQEGYSDRNSFLKELDLEVLVNKVEPEIKLVQAIKDGIFNEDLSAFLDSNYKGQELLSLGYDIINHGIVKVPVWRGGFFDRNRPVEKLSIICFSIFKSHFDWLYTAVKNEEVALFEDL